MITPSFGLTATERVLPKLALDFTTASLDSRVTFTRTTDATHPATYVNISGFVTTAIDNQPRFDYDPVTLACKGLLIEESRINYVLQSSAFNVAPWSSVNSTFGLNAINSPDGTLNATKLIEAASTAEHYIQQFFSITTNQAYTQSIFVKAGETSTFVLAVVASGSSSTVSLANFSISGGVISSGSFTGLISASSATPVGNGWYRCALTYTLNGTVTSHRIRIYPRSASSYLGDGTSGIYIWGAQMEAGAFATSYIPTTLIPLTRNADVATMTGTNFSDWFNASEGTFVAQLNYFGLNNCGMLGVDNGTDSQRMSLQSTSSTATTYRFVSSSGNFTSSSSAYTANSTIKVAYTYSAGSQSACVSTNLFAANTQASVATVDRLRIGTARAVNSLNGHIQTIDYYPQKLLNAELQAFTK